MEMTNLPIGDEALATAAPVAAARAPPSWLSSLRESFDHLHRRVQTPVGAHVKTDRRA